MFESTLPNLRGASIIVTSVLANFICDAGLLAPDKILDQTYAELSAHVHSLTSFSFSNPHIRIAIVPPLPRSNPEWFNPYLPCLTTFLFSEITKSGCSQVRYLSPFVAPPSFFESDGVHLNQDAGVQFIRFIIDGVDQIFPDHVVTETSSSSTFQTGVLPHPVVAMPGVNVQPFVPPPSSQVRTSLDSVPSTPSFAVEFSRISSALDTLTGITGHIRTETRVRRDQDNLIFARLKEDRDFEFNKNREDRFTITGFIAPDPPRDPRDRKEYYRLKLQELVDQACPDLSPRPRVLDAFVNMRYL